MMVDFLMYFCYNRNWMVPMAVLHTLIKRFFRRDV